MQGKRAALWDIVDIKELVGTEEGIHLEFKKPSEFVRDGKFSRDEFARQLAETVSAFLNSDGGVILVGVQTDKHSADKKAELLKPVEDWGSDQTLNRWGILLTSSQIRDLVHGNVLPSPPGIDVKSLDLPVGADTARVLVITVARSPVGAHQSIPTRLYYRRTGDGDVPMLDFEIRDVSSRRAGPLLHVLCKVPSKGRPPTEQDWRSSYADLTPALVGGATCRTAELVFAVSNYGRGTATIAVFDMGIPTDWQIAQYSPDGTDTGAHWLPRSGLRHTMGDRITVFWAPDRFPHVPLPFRQTKLSEQRVNWQQVVYSGNELPAHPIWPTSCPTVVGVLRLQGETGGTGDFSWLPWRALTHEMPETRGAILLREEHGELHVFSHEPDDVCWWHEGENEQVFEGLRQRFGVR